MNDDIKPVRVPIGVPYARLIFAPQEDRFLALVARQSSKKRTMIVHQALRVYAQLLNRYHCEDNLPSSLSEFSGLSLDPYGVNPGGSLEWLKSLDGGEVAQNDTPGEPKPVPASTELTDAEQSSGGSHPAKVSDSPKEVEQPAKASSGKVGVESGESEKPGSTKKETVEDKGEEKEEGAHRVWARGRIAQLTAGD